MGYAERNNPKSRRNGNRYKPVKVEKKAEKLMSSGDFDLAMMAMIMARKKGSRYGRIK